MTILDNDSATTAVTVRTERDWGLFIGGRSVPALSGRRYDDVSPATEQVIASVPDGGAQDVQVAVEAAQSGFATWRTVPPKQRGAVMRAMAAVLRDNVDELAALDAADAGNPVTAMRNDVEWSATVMELFADWAGDLGGATMPASTNLNYTTRQPFGVVARIVPFNHPLFFAASKLAAPIVAGNAVIIKPSELTPLSALRMAELFANLLPPGVLSVVVGDNLEVGRAIVASPAIRRIGFIGSERTGRAIQRDAADAGIKDITLELGGKNALIVCADADLDRAAAGAVSGMNFAVSAGQSCGSTSRLLLHESVAAEMTERILALTGAIKVGDPLDPTTEMGALSSPAQYAKTLSAIEAGRSSARLLTGGGRPAGLTGDNGYFVAPTIFADVDPRSVLGQEEIFGPVLSVMTFRTEQEAVAIANSLDYGLTASIWTEDLRRAHRLARDVEAGYVWVNGSSRHFWGMPFGGVKSSGIGREESIEELLSYTQLKSINVFLD